MTHKMQVYLNEFNVLMDKTVYLPLVSGLLHGYAANDPAISASYEFMPYLFVRQEPETIINRYQDPSVAAFSVFMWNERLSLHVAREVKNRYPDCLIVFGGQQVPHHAEEYLTRHPFIDIAVNGEGEETFREILCNFLASRDFSAIKGITWRNSSTGAIAFNEDREQIAKLDNIPSPYLSGLFDELLAANPELNFQAIIQSNRGCPFSCAYCSWHKNSSLRYFDLARVGDELEWCGKHGIKYIFSADSNFGIHKRDLEIARYLVGTKNKYSFPEKFRTCFTKNADERIFELSMLLFNSGLEKGVTLSFQSLNEAALKNVKRENIKLSTYRNLLAKFNATHVPIYTELILGLPGETEESWLKGIESVLEAGLEGQLFIYPCEVYTNTMMADPEYRREFGIVTTEIKLTEIHGAIRSDSCPAEYQELIIATNSMPHESWRNMLIFSWVMMTLYSLKLGFFVLRYLKNRLGINYSDAVAYFIRNPKGIIRKELEFFASQTTAIAEGQGRGVVLPEYGNVYWDTEEACFLRLSEHFDDFYRDLETIVRCLLADRAIDYDADELTELFRYQSLRTPRHSGNLVEEAIFSRNIPQYCEGGLESIVHGPSRMRILQPQYGDDLKRYAREIILWGRKSDRLLNQVTWSRI